MNALSKILLVVGLFLALFVVTMVVLFCIFGNTPDTLIQCVLGAGILEALLCATIKCVNVVKENKQEENKESDDVNYEL